MFSLVADYESSDDSSDDAQQSTSKFATISDDGVVIRTLLTDLVDTVELDRINEKSSIRSGISSRNENTDEQVISSLLSDLIHYVELGKIDQYSSTSVKGRVGYVDKDAIRTHRRKHSDSSYFESPVTSDDDSDFGSTIGFSHTSDGYDTDDSDKLFNKIMAIDRKRRQNLHVNVGRPPATKGELRLEDLPPIENLHISVPPTVQLVRVGVVTSIVGCLAVIQSDGNGPALDEETWLLDESGNSIGQVFEIFGPVMQPMYSVRFNNSEDAQTKLTTDFVVYCAPSRRDLTHTVFTEGLKTIRGSDASWEDNNEPPDGVRDFSDDEEERKWKAQRRNGRRLQETDDTDSLSDLMPTSEDCPRGRRPVLRARRNAGFMHDGGRGGFQRGQGYRGDYGGRGFYGGDRGRGFRGGDRGRGFYGGDRGRGFHGGDRGRGFYGGDRGRGFYGGDRGRRGWGYGPGPERDGPFAVPYAMQNPWGSFVVPPPQQNYRSLWHAPSQDFEQNGNSQPLQAPSPLFGTQSTFTNSEPQASSSDDASGSAQSEQTGL